jgi:hypothetical protein
MTTAPKPIKKDDIGAWYVSRPNTIQSSLVNIEAVLGSLAGKIRDRVGEPVQFRNVFKADKTPSEFIKATLVDSNREVPISKQDIGTWLLERGEKDLVEFIASMMIGPPAGKPDGTPMQRFEHKVNALVGTSGIGSVGYIKRVLYDNLFGECWESVIDRPAYKHLTPQNLSWLISTADAIMENPTILSNLRRESEIIRERAQQASSS